MAHPHPHSHLVSSIPARAPALFLAAPVGQPSHHPRYATSHNYPESPSLRFMDMELESEAQLLNALPPPIRRHQGQRYTFGTGVGDTWVRLTLDRMLSLIFNTSSKLRLYSQSTPLRAIRRMCPILLNLIGITSTSLHRHRQPHCAPWNPKEMSRFPVSVFP